MEEPEGSFIRFDDDDDDRPLVTPYDGDLSREWAGPQYDPGGYSNVDSPSDGYGYIQRQHTYRGYRKRVKDKDGSFSSYICALTDADLKNRDIRDEKDSIARQEASTLSPLASKFLRSIDKNRRKKNPAAGLTARNQAEQIALDEAINAWDRITEAWNLITPTCETRGCGNPAKHHSVPLSRPKMPRESCDPCNQFFRNHQEWPTKDKDHQ
jgi:hypothetical protein